MKTALTQIDVFDVTFPGYGGEPVKAWLSVPHGASGPLPAVVEYNGYGGGRGLPHERLTWAAAGYAHLFMDTRGQGSGWGSGGETPDPHGSGPAAPGFMTRGIDSPSQYYYRRVFTDAVRAVDAVRTLGSWSIRPASRWPAAARAAASRSRSAGWSTIWSRSCPTSRSSATSSGRSDSPIAIPTRRSRGTSR